jgi:uncharacterized protein DUF3168
MKDIRRGFRAVLLADPTVSGLVAGERIYFERLPENMRLPSIVYHRITGASDYHMAGDSGLESILMQTEAWAVDGASAVALADAAFDALSGYHDRINFGSGEFINIQGIFHNNSTDVFDEPTKLYGMRRDYRVYFEAR